MTSVTLYMRMHVIYTLIYAGDYPHAWSPCGQTTADVPLIGLLLACMLLVGLYLLASPWCINRGPAACMHVLGASLNGLLLSCMILVHHASQWFYVFIHINH